MSIDSLGVSVVICCYNSAQRIEGTLQALSKQKVPFDLSWEVVIINNNCSDDTVEISKRIWRELGSPVQLNIYDENMPGVAAARVKGLRCSKFEFVLFCDDDNWLCNDYVARVFNILHSNQEIGAVGGYGIAIGEVELPIWFEKYAHGYAVGKPNYETGIIPQNHYLVSAGMGLRKSPLLFSLNKLPLLLSGRDKENSLIPGEDTEICFRFLFLNFKLYYDSNLIFKHFLPKERLNVEYRNKMFDGFVKSSRVLDCYAWAWKYHKMDFFSKSIEIIKAIIRIPFSKFKLVKRWEIGRDLAVFYLATNILLGNIDIIYIQVKQLSRLSFAKSTKKNKVLPSADY